eukprot:CAMPEP_0175125486 /NCGR_PEP_ID=MMETSP0087-20121206/3339_1 /TAXON_ID=136419 /ORGANISM="Unknown Unknown, Strain D1" /LENGTH=523 /DNA_ID=CAMNT_0016407321 /DNA_START=18 /DNA_END=1589 /DNA_ORIENTATION=-
MLLSVRSKLFRHSRQAVRALVAPAATYLKPFHRGFSGSTYEHVMHEHRMNANVLNAEYAVRGKLVLMAEELQKQLKQPNHNLPFNEILFCNIGNPQSVGQKPLSFVRQVLSLVVNPELLHPDKLDITQMLFPHDVITRAQNALKETAGGFGAYSHSMGVPWIRENVAKFIADRDGFPADPDSIFLTNGASDGISNVLSMLTRNEQDGVMIPIPQYPLYSATLALLGAQQIPYYLNENDKWGSSLSNMESSIQAAKDKGVCPRAMCVINPGNPTGQVLSYDNMVDIIKFCSKHRLVLLADEVYQSNIYTSEAPFHSFKKVLFEMGEEYQGRFELLSFHSTSKGFLGECGMRGGYMEVVGMHPFVKEQLYKLVSISLCSNLPGQVMTDLMVNPPQAGDASYEQYMREKDGIVQSLGRRARKVAAAFNAMEGVSCNDAQGAMYLFPRFSVPAKAAAAAAAEGLPADVHYCVELLNSTGVCVVPGSGFGQEAATWHFRTTFLPPEEKMDGVIEKMSSFHKEYMAKWG